MFVDLYSKYIAEGLSANSTASMNNSVVAANENSTLAVAGLIFYTATHTDEPSAMTTTTTTTSLDCHDPENMLLKKFVIGIKKYMYPATIEFSITMATIFIIMSSEFFGSVFSKVL